MIPLFWLFNERYPLYMPLFTRKSMPLQECKTKVLSKNEMRERASKEHATCSMRDAPRHAGAIICKERVRQREILPQNDEFYAIRNDIILWLSMILRLQRPEDYRYAHARHDAERVLINEKKNAPQTKDITRDETRCSQRENEKDIRYACCMLIAASR